MFVVRLGWRSSSSQKSRSVVMGPFFRGDEGGEPPRRGLCHEGAPAAEVGDIAGAVDIGAFDNETFDAAAIGKPDGADRQWRRGRGDEIFERRPRARPDFQFDRR